MISAACFLFYELEILLCRQKPNSAAVFSILSAT